MSLIKTIIINILACIVIYILFEIFSGAYFKGNSMKLNQYSYLVINKQIERKHNLYTKEDITVRYKRDQFGFKDRFKEIDKVDVVTLGGSTTEQKYLTIENTWTDILEKKINKNSTNKIDIVNAGISGRSSKGHVWDLKKRFKNIEGFRPKYIIFYMGLNETEHDNTKNDPQSFQTALYPARLALDEKLSLFQIIKKYLKINNGLTYKLHLKITLQERALNQVWHNVFRFYYPYKKISNEAHIFSDSTFVRLKNRLDKINQLTKELGAIPIFVTQNSLRWKKDEEIIYSIDNINYYYNEMNIAKTIINFCKKNKIKCIDGFNELKFIRQDDITSKDNDTFDLLHTAPSGSKKIAELIYKDINSLF